MSAEDDPTISLAPQHHLAPAPDEPGLPTVRAPAEKAPLADDGMAAADLQCRLPQYRVRELIGRGGMGLVLKADDPKLSRTVALKTMKLGAEATEEQRGRFVREATVLARLAHPNLVPIYDLGTDDEGRPFYTMKLVKGRTLREIIKDLRDAVPDAARLHSLGRLLAIFRKVCDAVAFAHSHGVLHRDLKPDNIMVGEFGEVLVMDWGLAKFLRESDEPWSSAIISRSVGEQQQHASFGATAPGTTLDGSLMGTPQYMSPEQAAGKNTELDERSDIFSLGSILYSILTLHPPVEGRTLQEVLRKLSSGQIAPPSAFGAKSASHSPPGATGEVLEPRVFRPLPHCPGGRVPAALSAVTMRALALDPARRYQSVNEFSADVEAYQSGFATRAEQAGLGRQIVLLVRRHRGICATAAAAWLIITALAVWFLINVTRAKNQAETARHRAAANEARAVEGENLAVANEKRATETLTKLRATAPVFVAQAQALIERHDFAGALEKVEIALDLTPAAASHTLRGHLLQSLQRIPEARDAYARALALQPGDTTARAALAVCEEILRRQPAGTTLDKTSLGRLNRLMREQHRDAEATAMLRFLGTDRDALLKTWKPILAQHGIDLKPEMLGDDGLFTLGLYGRAKLDDISFLRGMPLADLSLDSCPVSDLRPLEDAPLRKLNLTNTKVLDLRPLHGMPLEDLNLESTHVSDLSPLQGMRLRRFSAWYDTELRDISPLRGMPLVMINLQGTNVRDISSLAGMPLEDANLKTSGISNFSVLRGMKLRKLTIIDLSDLTLLSGMPLENLLLQRCGVRDLSPLRGLPLTSLGLHQMQVSDISPLKDVQLETFVLRVTVSDLSPLRGQPVQIADLRGFTGTDYEVLKTWKLRALRVGPNFSDARVLANQPLEQLFANDSSLSDLSPLRGLPLTYLDLWGTKVTDLKLLADIPTLRKLNLPATALDLSPLRELRNLQCLDRKPLPDGTDTYRTVEDFWKDEPAYAAELKKMTPLLENLRQAFTAAKIEGLKDDTFTFSRGAKIYANLTDTGISDLGLLRGYPVDEVHLSGTKVTSLEPLRELPVVKVYFNGTKVTDASPLAAISTLEYVILGPEVANVEVLRNSKSIRWISYDFVSRDGLNFPTLSAAEFWQRYDAEKAATKK